MRFRTWLLVVSFLFSNRCMGDWRGQIRAGLPITFVVHVVDETGMCVSNVTCKVLFPSYLAYPRERLFMANDFGEISISGKASVGNIVASFFAEGYYSVLCKEFGFLPTTKGDAFKDELKAAARRGYWIPHEQSTTVVMKRKVNPPYVPRRKAIVPIKYGESSKQWLNLRNQSITNALPIFDECDYIEIQSNYIAKPDTGDVTNFHYHVSISSPMSSGGFIIVPTDNQSEYEYPTEAPKEGYNQSILLFGSMHNRRMTSYQGFDSKCAIYRIIDKNDGNRFAIIVAAYFDRHSALNKRGKATLTIEFFLLPSKNDMRTEFRPVSEIQWDYMKSHGLIDDNGMPIGK